MGDSNPTSSFASSPEGILARGDSAHPPGGAAPVAPGRRRACTTVSTQGSSSTPASRCGLRPTARTSDRTAG
jgi:hypothetical protein